MGRFENILTKYRIDTPPKMISALLPPARNRGSTPPWYHDLEFLINNKLFGFVSSQYKRSNQTVERLPPAKFSRGLVANEDYRRENNNQTLADKSFRSLPNSSTHHRKQSSIIFLEGWYHSALFDKLILLLTRSTWSNPIKRSGNNVNQW